MKRLLLILLFGFASIPALVAGPIRISFKDTTMVRGGTVYIPVRVDSSVTGLNVFSYELDISYAASGALIDTAVAAGSMTSGWIPPVYHLTPGGITISSAGITPLTGTGSLVFIRVKLPLSGTAGATSLTLNKAMFNEGTPATTLRSGTIFITNPPTITVYPDIALLTVGETQQFNVSGGTAPFTWSSTSPSTGSINSSGVLTALSAGFCKVVAVDANGTRDTNQQVEIRACKLSLRDTTYRQGQTFLLPIYISDLSAVDIFSGTFTLSYNTNVLTAIGVSQTGTLLAPSGAPAFDINPGSVTVGFATTSRLSGVGQQVLVYIRFLVTSVNTYGTSLTFSNILFNESITATNVNASFTPISTSSLTVSPNTATLVAGDSLQFSVSGGAVNPVVWSVSNPSLATISAGGMLKALASGTLQVSVVDANNNTGKSGTITLYDIRLQLPVITTSAGYIVDQTFMIDRFPPGIYSAQFFVNYNSTYLTALSVTTAGTLSASWMTALDSPSPGTAIIAGAGAQPITTQGLLMKLRFQVANNAPVGSYPISLTNTMLNEGKPLPLITNGTIVVSSTTVTQSLLLGWNMVSIPLNLPDMRKTTLYPTATTKAFWYNGTYTAPDTLQNRLGYWLKFSSAQSTLLSGAPRSRDTIALRANGWNMIGSVAFPIPKSAIVYNPPSNTISPYYTYVAGSGYKIQDTIKPGVGYWIKTASAGNLVLDYANAPPAAAEKSASAPGTLNELTISQLLETGDETAPSRLYFGEHAASTGGIGEYELPPLPPPGSFDVRFASNRYVAELSAGDRELPIVVQTEGHAIIISWKIVSAPHIPYVLVEKRDGRVVAERELTLEGSMRVADPENVTLGLAMKSRPAEFSLSQNYPNPFNPATVIRYTVPAGNDKILSYNVSLKVYNMLGQMVATVVDEEQSPGEKSVRFDAGNLASGMYIYKLTAGNLTATRKMVLLR